MFETNTSHGWLFYSKLNGEFVLDANRITLPELATLLRKEIGVPVLDKTGLNGFYQVSMPVPAVWLRAATRPQDASGSSSPEASDPSGVSIFKSVEKLGLRLDKALAPINNLAVSHLENTPTEN